MSSTWPNVRFDYTGAAVLVTGGTSGIGAGIAAAYRAAGRGGPHHRYASRASPSTTTTSPAIAIVRLDIEDAASIDAVAASCRGSTCS